MNSFVLDLAGAWNLSGRKECGCEPGIFSDAEISIPAAVPGNIELDLLNNGLINDPYVKLNAKELRKYEFYEWVFSREFNMTGLNGTLNFVPRV